MSPNIPTIYTEYFNYPNHFNLECIFPFVCNVYLLPLSTKVLIKIMPNHEKFIPWTMHMTHVITKTTIPEKILPKHEHLC